MPGITGFATATSIGGDSGSVLKKMQDLITHQPFYVKDALFNEGEVFGTRSHIGVVQKEAQPYSSQDVNVWLDGEFHNREELLRDIGEKSSPDTAILCKMYKRSKDLSFLKRIDGIYCAVIHDSARKTLHLITDRFGLGHIYWRTDAGSLAWGSEYKVMLALPSFVPKIEKNALQSFLAKGFLSGGCTWFEGVELLRAGTVLTWDIREASMKTTQYWSWDDLRRPADYMDESQVSWEMGRLFTDAVRRRCEKGEKVGIFLSGGLDSRAVLAAMPDTGNPIHAFTVGKRNSDDIRFAGMAAKVKGAMHHVIEISGDNWLKPRFDVVWWLDGQLDLIHMHGVEALPMVSECCDITLNGFWGDPVLGGLYISDPTMSQEEYFQDRGRRLMVLGPRMSRTFVEARLPFADNRLVEYTFSTPEKVREGAFIYKRMLLELYPDYYRSIPWQKTGEPIGRSRLVSKVFKMSAKVRDGILKVIPQLGGESTYDYLDYPHWIRQEPARSFFNDTLRDPGALYRGHIDGSQVIADIDGHSGGEDRAASLCRYMTLEIWLQQVFAGKYRPAAG